ncbi:MAG: ArnT family glycosyltransferase [Ktedonobacterales bacterium]
MAKTGSARAESAAARRPANPWQWIARLRFETRLLVLIGALAVGLRVWPLGGGATDYDEGVYWQSLRALAAGHPLFTSLFSSQPPGFLEGLFPFYLLFGQSLVAARLGVALYSLAGVAAIYLIGRAIAGRWMGIAACALLALDPLYVRESRTLQAEAPAVALQLVCVALAVLAAREPRDRRRRLLAFAAGVALALGVLVKLFDVVAAIPAVLYLAAPLYPAFREATTGRLRRPGAVALRSGLRLASENIALLAAGALLAGVLLLVPYLAHWSAFYDQVVAFHLAAAQAVNRGLRANLKLVLGAGEEYPLALVALAALGLALLRRDWRVIPPALWLAASLALLLDQQPLFPHHLVLLAPGLALLAALALPLAFPRLDAHPALAPRSLNGLAPIVGALLAVVLLLSLALSAVDDQAAAQPPDTAATRAALALQRLTLPADLVASDDQYVAALAGRDVPPELVDTSEVRIASGYLTASQIEAILTRDNVRVVLFESGRFREIPGFAAWVRANYGEVLDLGGGHALYLKTPPQPVTRA